MTYPYYNTTDSTVFIRDITHCSVLLFNCATLLCTISLIVRNRRTVFTDQIYTLWLAYLSTRLLGNLFGLDPVVKHLPRAIAQYLIEDSSICSHVLGFLALAFVRLPAMPMQLGISLYILMVIQFPIYFYQNRDSLLLKYRIKVFVLGVYAGSFLLGCVAMTHFRIVECINDTIQERDQPLLPWPSATSVFLLVALLHFGISLVTAFIYIHISLCATSCAKDKDLLSETTAREGRKIQRRLGAIGLTSFFVSALIDLIQLVASNHVALLLMRLLMCIDYGVDPWLMLLKNSDFRRVCFTALGLARLAPKKSDDCQLN